MASKLHVPAVFRKAAAYIIIRPTTTKYPFSKLDLPESFRGQPIFNSNLCIGCGVCSKNCPSSAIAMVEIGKKRYPQIDLGKCIFCSQCVDICPKKAVTNSHNFELATTNKASLIINPELAAFR